VVAGHWLKDAVLLISGAACELGMKCYPLNVMYGRPLAGKEFFSAFGVWIGAVLYAAFLVRRFGRWPRC
jgi:hypothetical protein